MILHPMKLRSSDKMYFECMTCNQPVSNTHDFTHKLVSLGVHANLFKMHRKNKDIEYLAAQITKAIDSLTELWAELKSQSITISEYMEIIKYRKYKEAVLIIDSKEKDTPITYAESVNKLKKIEEILNLKCLPQEYDLYGTNIVAQSPYGNGGKQTSLLSMSCYSSMANKKEQPKSPKKFNASPRNTKLNQVNIKDSPLKKLVDFNATIKKQFTQLTSISATNILTQCKHAISIPAANILMGKRHHTSMCLEQSVYSKIKKISECSVFAFNPTIKKVKTATPYKIRMPMVDVLADIGLTNIGNSCYFNTALQVIKFAYPLSYYLKLNSTTVKGSFSKAFSNLYYNFWTSKNYCLNPATVFNELSSNCPNFIAGMQYDSYEALIQMLSIFNKENYTCVYEQKIIYPLADTPTFDKQFIEGVIYQLVTFENSIINDLFCNIGVRSYICPTCKCSVSMVENKYGFELDLDDCSTIYNTLELFFKEMYCDNYRCTKCKNYVRIQIKYDLLSPAPILVFQFKRFRKHENGFKKSNTNIQTLDTLDIAEYLSFKQKNTLYELTSIGIHSGSLNGGHYYAYGYNIFTKEWMEFNDSSCSKISSHSNNGAITLLYLRSDLRNPDSFSSMECFEKLSLLSRLNSL